MTATMAVHVTLFTLFIITNVRWCSASEIDKNSQTSVTRTMNQLRSILAFLPRPQKCDKLLFDLMKECVDEANVVSVPATTRQPEPAPIHRVPDEIPISIRAPPAPSAPADDEDSSIQGSGHLPVPQALPERALGYRPVQHQAFDRTSNRKSKKSKRKSRLLKLKKVGLKRTLKTSREDTETFETVPTFATVSRGVRKEATNAGAVVTQKKQENKDPTNMRAHSPEFFKYMGMG